MHYYRYLSSDRISYARNHGCHPRQVSSAHQDGDRGGRPCELDLVVHRRKHLGRARGGAARCGHGFCHGGPDTEGIAGRDAAAALHPKARRRRRSDRSRCLPQPRDRRGAAACRQQHSGRRTRAGAWQKEDARGMHRQLQNKTVGLVGFGAIGKEVAKRLRGFEVTIIYYDPVRASRDVEQSLDVRYADLDALVRTADIVSLHLPLLPQTAGIISAQRIRAMKSGAVVINCARGGLVDEAALVAALKDGRLFGAGIDAFASEPPVGSELLALENTVVTSHLAGATLDNFSGIVARAVENAKVFLRGDALPETDVVIAPGRKVPVA